MHPVAVHWAKKSNCSAKEGYSASFRLSAYNDSCTALTHNWESLQLNTYKTTHIAHFMMWEKKWAVLWLIQKHVGKRRNQSLNCCCMTKVLCSMQKVQSPMDSKCLYFSWPREVTTIQTWVWQKFGTKFSDHYLDNSSGQEKKRPSSDVLGTRPRGLDPTGQNSPTDSQTPISVVSEGRHEGEYRDTTPLLQYLWTINDSAKMSSEISCRWLAKRGN